MTLTAVHLYLSLEEKGPLAIPQRAVPSPKCFQSQEWGEGVKYSEAG